MRYIGLMLLSAALLLGQPRREDGEINGARFRIEIPENWNGALILFCHGYSNNTSLHAAPATLLTTRGFAVAQSGYSAAGWAVEEAAQDTEALRRYFIRKYGTPKRTYVAGMSMGGHLTAAMLERFPDAYDGGLALCAELAPAYLFFEKRVFDLRVVFDYYFPGVLPSPVEVSPSYARSKQKTAEIGALLDSKPEQAAALRQFAGVRTNPELAGILDFANEILGELRKRSGGNAFDNRTTLYEGSPDDEALNDGVRRYAADAEASAYVRNHFNLSAALQKPMLALHTTYDALVPSWTVNLYGAMAEQAGVGDRFAVQYVKRNGHCTFQPDEITRALAHLTAWVETGTKPQSGALR